MSSKNWKFTFKCALRGLKIAAREPALRIFLVVSLLVIGAMFWLGIPTVERMLLLLAIGVTLSLELLNSQVERILDYFCPENDSRIRAIKDISAGAVLLIVIFDVVIGLVVLLPEFLSKVQLW